MKENAFARTRVNGEQKDLNALMTTLSYCVL